jgi:preprotein translocase subunit SecG
VYAVLLVLLILDGLLMTVIVLLQAGKGGGLASMGGSGGTMADQLIGGRQAATLLTKATWTTGGLFLALSLLLSVISTRQQNAGSILENQFRPAPTQPLVPQGNAPTTPPALPGTPPANNTPGNQPPRSGTGN